jgi:hypothetical protein
MSTTFLRMDTSVSVSRRDLNQSLAIVDKMLVELPNQCNGLNPDLLRLKAKLLGMRPKKSH